MDMLWSMSTTVREAERIEGFLKTAVLLEGENWDKKHQIEFQTRLIMYRQYLNNPDNTQTFNGLNEAQSLLLKDKSIDMTYEQAKDIFDAKNYEDPSMRGRQSMAPLQKLGLVYIYGSPKKVHISEVGMKLARGEIKFEDFMLDSLLKYQYPNPYESGFRDWNTKPFINTLRLIKTVNEMCEKAGKKAKGISKTEFGIFALSLKSYEDIDKVAKKLLEFRNDYEATADDMKDNFAENFIKSYLVDFKNPVKNVKEYTDNMVRYLRLTKYIYIRGKYAHTYIDLEPRRMTEINAILEADDGSARTYTEEEWRNYMGVYGTYELPFETVETLTTILNDINTEISSIEDELELAHAPATVPATKEELKEFIADKRTYRTKLQNLQIKQQYHKDTKKIDEAIEALEDIRTHNKANLAKKYSVELERWSNVALNILNDAKYIKPNAPVGDDNEPIYTAPNGVADIECYYNEFTAICEVTMLTSRDQWYNEGQPVMRHLRQFEDANNDKNSYCLFVAPTIHTDTLNTFYMAVKYEYEGRAQKIIPITIGQLEHILKTIKDMTEKGRKFKHTNLMDLYNKCSDVSQVANSTLWLEYINNELNNWAEQLVA